MRLFAAVLLGIVSFLLGSGYGFLLHRNHIFPYELIRPPRPAPAVEATQGSPQEDRANFYRAFPEQGEVVMVGDSITQFADFGAMFPGASIVNRGISGDTTAGILSRLDVVTATKTREAFILLGVNDVLAGLSPDGITRNYRAIIEALNRAGIMVTVQSTLLTRRHDLNGPINRLNQLLNEHCQTTRKCVFLDLNANLTTDNLLRAEYALDHVHLTAAGYRAWRDILTPVLSID